MPQGLAAAIGKRARLIAINRSRRDLYLNRRPDLAVHADPFDFVCALASGLKNPREIWKDWIDGLNRSQLERLRQIDELARAEAGEGINPLYLLKRLEAQLPEHAVVVADGGDFVASAAYLYRPRGALGWLDPGVFGTLGVGAGFALGVKRMQPTKEVWLLYGDGAAGGTPVLINALIGKTDYRKGSISM